MDITPSTMGGGSAATPIRGSSNGHYSSSAAASTIPVVRYLMGVPSDADRALFKGAATAYIVVRAPVGETLVNTSDNAARVKCMRSVQRSVSLRCLWLGRLR